MERLHGGRVGASWCKSRAFAHQGIDFRGTSLIAQHFVRVASLRGTTSLASMIVITRKDRELPGWLPRLSTGAGPQANQAQSSSIGSSVQ